MILSCPIVNSILLFCLILNVNSDQSESCGCSVGRSKSSECNSEGDVAHNKYSENPANSEQCSRPEKPPKSSESGEPKSKFTPGSKEEVLSKMSLIPGGEYIVGTDKPVIVADREGPARKVALKPFYIDKYEVSNEEFATFAAATGYKSEAELFGDSFVFTLFLNESVKKELEDYRVLQAPWWYKVTGASWMQPEGEGSSFLG